MASTLLDDIKNKTFKTCYLITGSEPFLVKFYRNKLINAIVNKDDEMNYSVFTKREINNSDLSNVREIADTLPFFAEKRVVLLSDTGLLKNKSDFAEYIPKIPDTTVIIFDESEVDKRSSVYKAISKYGLVASYDPYSPAKLNMWIGGLCKNYGRQITESDAAFLADRVGTDMFTLKNEIVKLTDYTLGKDAITRSDIEAVTETRPQDQIFKMMDAIGKHDRKQALDYYYDLLKMDQSPILILYMFNRHMNILLQVKDLARMGRQGEASTLLKIPPFTVRNYLSQANNFEAGFLKHAFEEGVNIDEAIKTGKVTDRIGVESLIIKTSGYKR
ncbi:MAG: DNA polymerase III subunit delta [Catonella sp.]|jgi:DNA polymerase-3 subunit delta|nr:DNA polymerase III subunit delta [Catonella sp.]MDY6356109.1 DNA polymerase III subunit delta [Catonella sp.]